MFCTKSNQVISLKKLKEKFSHTEKKVEFLNIALVDVTVSGFQLSSGLHASIRTSLPMSHNATEVYNGGQFHAKANPTAASVW